MPLGWKTLRGPRRGRGGRGNWRTAAQAELGRAGQLDPTACAGKREVHPTLNAEPCVIRVLVSASRAVHDRTLLLPWRRVRARREMPSSNSTPVVRLRTSKFTSGSCCDLAPERSPSILSSQDVLLVQGMCRRMRSATPRASSPRRLAEHLTSVLRRRAKWRSNTSSAPEK